MCTTMRIKGNIFTVSITHFFKDGLAVCVLTLLRAHAIIAHTPVGHTFLWVLMFDISHVIAFLEETYNAYS